MLVVGILLALTLAGIPAIMQFQHGVPSLRGTQPLETVATVTDPVTVTVSNASSPISPYFWGTTLSARAAPLVNQGEILNATPTQTIVWPGGAAGDDYDPLTNQLFTRSGSYVTAPSSVAEFAAQCLAMHCNAIIELPGEVDNASLAAQVVRYTESTLGLHPLYWEIGNEPELWAHWKLNWSVWAGSQNAQTPPTPTQYAQEEAAYIAAVRSVDPTARFIGLPGIGPSSYTQQDWINAIVQTNGPQLSAMAIHIYPLGSTSGSTLSDFYGGLSGTNSLPHRLSALENQTQRAISSYCPTTCGPISPVLTEVGTALSHTPTSIYAVGFPGALFMGAEMTQGINANAVSVDLYATSADTASSWFTMGGSVRPDYTMYASMLSHIGTEIHPVGLTSGNGITSAMYAVASVAPNDSGRRDLFIENTNLSTSASLALSLPPLWNTGALETWTWVNNTTLEPTAAYSSAGPVGPLVLPPQSAVLFEWRAAPAAEVRFTATGIPSSARWFLGVDGSTETSVTPTLTFFLSEGNHSLVPGPAFPVKHGVRLAPDVPPRVAVGSGIENMTVPYLTQYLANISARPAGEGVVVPGGGWVFAGTSTTLHAVPYTGFGFRFWRGWGPGSVNATALNITISVEGPLTETAVFDYAYPVNFSESGLGANATWGVTIENVSYLTSRSSLVVNEVNGTFDYWVVGPPSYTSSPSAGSFTVAGSSVTVPSIMFGQSFTNYTLTWVETGLRTGLRWGISLDGKLLESQGTSVSFRATNGTYSYSVSAPTGWQSTPASGSVSVDGSSVETSLVFSLAPPQYLVTWNERGLPMGTLWGITIAGQPNESVGPSITALEANGTYTYSVLAVPGFVSNPPGGEFTVAGVASTLTISFVSMRAGEFMVAFGEVGLPRGSTWTVDVNGSVESSTTPTMVFGLPNGSFSFTVGAVPGFSVNPASGNVTVSAGPVNVSVVFRSAVAASGTTPASFLGLSPLDTLLVLSGVALAVIAVVGYSAARHRRGPNPPG